jgi:Tol biopolymer transport system component
VPQVYIRNIARHTTTLVSRTGAGVPGNGPSLGGAISPGGRFVLFTSRATNLVPGDTNGHEDVFVRDRRRGTTRRIDLGPRGQANGDSFALGISAGGRYRLYESAGSNLVPGDTNHAADLFLRDRHTGRTVRVDLTSTGEQADHGVGNAGDIGVAMTPGGRWVAFVSPSTNLVAPGVGGAHLYRRGPLY